jgi:tRNA(fMet)-specific endonuclease VapC
MAIVLDSDVIIAGERGSLELEEWMAARADEVFEVATITVAELLHGVERASTSHRAKREKYVEKIISVTRILPYLETTARIHARLWAKLESKGQMIGDYDLIISATALERGSTLATYNKRHFKYVPGLRLIEPN